MYSSHLIIIPLDFPLLAEGLPQCRRVALTVEYSPPSEDRELCASANIARYGIEQSDSESSSSPLYTAPNTPSSSKRNSEDLEKFPMDSEPEDRISRLKSELSEAKERARVQQNTLDHILTLLQQLPIPEAPQAPQDLLSLHP